MDIKEALKEAETKRIIKLMEEELALKNSMKTDVQNTLEKGRMRRRMSTMAGTNLSEDQIA